MPNHVKQRMTLVGPDDDIRAFVDLANAPAPKTGDEPGSFNYSEVAHMLILSFHAIVPLPPEYHTTPYSTDGFSGGGYGMERDTWGVKWGAYDAQMPEFADGRVTYNFTCAWGPPVRFYQKASKRFPNLHFFVAYGGEGPCAGRLYLKNGEIIFEEHPVYDAGDYPSEDDYLDADGVLDDERYFEAYEAAEERYIRSQDSWIAEVLS